MRTIMHVLDGQPWRGSPENTSAVYDPATGEQTSEVLLASPADVDEVVGRARLAAQAWGATSLGRRASVLFAFRQALLEASDPALDVVTLLRVQAVTANDAKPALDFARILAQATGLAIGQDIAAIQLADLALDLVDPNLEMANLAIVVLIAVGIALRDREILGGSRGRDSESRRGDSE